MKLAVRECWNIFKNPQHATKAQKNKNGHIEKGRKHFTCVTSFPRPA